MSSVSPIDTTQMPADVQKAGPAAQKLYSTALAFENVLVQQLTKELDTSQNADQSSDDGSSDDGSSGDGTTAMYQQMLPGALAQGITNAGGIGLADELYRSLSPGTTK
jgi:Rod binding domain-containing protein